MQGDFGVADDEGMSGVVSPLEARDAMGVFGEEVDNLAFPLVAPLQPDDRDDAHNASPRATRGRGSFRNGGNAKNIFPIITFRGMQIPL